MKDLAIFGCGGFGREVACLINKINRVEPTWNFLGFYDDGHERGEKNDMGPVLGNVEDLNKVNKPLAVVIVIGNPQTVKIVRDKITNKNIYFPNIIDPDTEFMNNNLISLGEGNVICTHCLFSLNVKIGNFNSFNGSIGVGHDTVIGDYNAIMPEVRISGNVIIGNLNFFGLKSGVIQGKKIGDNTKIGAGSVLMNNTRDGYLYIGTPARIFKIGR